MIQDQLRTATAIALTVPKAVMTLGLDDGRTLRVSHDAGVEPDVAPCSVRETLVALHHPDIGIGARELLGRIESVELGGPFLDDHGGGLYGFLECVRPVRCFPTLLTSDRARALVESVDPGPPSDEIQARLVPDSILGTVTVFLTGAPCGPVEAVHAVARDALGACLVAELVDDPVASGFSW